MNDLLIGSGGYNGIRFLGALEYLHENELLDLKRFYGCSIGSIIGIYYIIGFKPKEILDIFINLNIFEVVKYDVKNIPKNKSILDHSLIERLFEKLWGKIPENITIEEFVNKTGVDINIHVTNITRNIYESFNIRTRPTVQLKDAIKASMSIPFIFPSVNINSEEFVDGGCKNLIGTPPDNDYILGYSILSIGQEQGYFLRVVKSICNMDLPRSVFTIVCYSTDDASKYLNLNKQNKLLILDMYQSGINSAIKSLQ